MEDSKDSVIKDKMMNAIRQATASKDEASPTKKSDTAPEGNLFAPWNKEKEIEFVQKFSKSGGAFIFCEDIADLVNKLTRAANAYNWHNIFCNDLKLREILSAAGIANSDNIENQSSIEVGMTSCEYLIAQHGSIVTSTVVDPTKKLSIITDTHIVVAPIDKVVPDIGTALSLLQEKYSNYLPAQISIITGPSKSNSVEEQFIIGGQGPHKLFLFMVNSNL
ncbi:MAG: LUD domain-containing protein [Bacteroidales bacterium]|nr:LUD domain-containing protein [Bacteroidales bacterium]